MAVFDSKHWNSEVFGKYLTTVPRVKQNAFLTSGIFRNRPDLKTMLNDQTGGNYISIPITGRIGGAALNYDGNTNITATGIDTYLQSMIVVGRAKAWVEKDFTFDLTGHDFMEDIARQVADYWDDVDQQAVLSILAGIFKVTTGSFSADHTLDITGATTKTVGPDTLNNAIQKAAGANKNIFTMAIMHSQVATNLENQELLTYRTQTDANGIQRRLNLADWNGRTVLIDDDVPATSTEGGIAYETYILGQGAFDYCDCGAKVPNETSRDPKTNGGEDYLITRQRKLFAPQGFSFVQPNSAIISPTNTQLETASNWNLVASSTSGVYYPTKAIPIVRIKSLG